MEATRDRRGLVVHDDNGAVYAATSDPDEAGTFVGEERPWLARQGLRPAGYWISHRPPHYSGDMPPTHSTCAVEWIDPADPRRVTNPTTDGKTTKERST